MADDMNKKGSNILGPQAQLEQLGKELAESLKSRSLEEERLRQRAETLQAIKGALDAGYSSEKLKKYFPYIRDFNSIPNQIRTEQEKIKLHTHRSLEMAGSQFGRAVESQFGKTEQNRLITRQQNSIEVAQIAATFKDYKYTELADIAAGGRTEIESIGRGASKIARQDIFSSRTISNPNQMGSTTGYARIGEQLSRRDEMINYVAAAESEMRRRKLQGIDPKSIEAEKFQYLNKAKKLQLEETIRATGQFKTADIESGKDVFVDVKDSTKRLNDLFKELISVTERLSSTSEKLDDKQREELKNKEQLITQSIKDTEFAAKIGKGISDGGRGNWMSGLNALAGGFGAMGSAAQNILVNQRMQQTSNIAGFAGLANQQYDMYQKARAGDIASQLALTQWGEAGQFGAEMRRGTNTALGLHAAGSAAQIAAGGVQLAEGGVQKFNPMSHLLGTGAQNTQEIIGGTLNVTQGLATGATVGMDMLRGTSARGAELQGIQANMVARMAVQAIPAKQMQGLRDFYTGLDVVGQNMGRGANQFLGNATNIQNLERMQAAGLSPEQFTQMAQIGTEQIGSMFSVNQIFGARNLERQGFGSMQNNMIRMSQLAMAGSNNPQAGMESVLAAAVSKGFDNSKVATDMLTQFTTNISSMSAGAAVGIDTQAATASMLANSMNPMMANKEFALQQAMTAQEITRQATTNREVSFTGMTNTAGIQRSLAKAGINIGGTEALIAQGIDIQTLKSLQNDPQKAAAFFRNQGVNVTQDNAGKAVDIIMAEKEKQLLRPGGFAINADLEGLRTRIKEGKLAPGDELQLGQIAQLQGRKGGAEELIREIKGVKAPNLASTGLTTTPGDTKDLKNQMDQLRTSGFKQLSESAISASKDLEKFGGALKVFTELQKQFEKGGVETEKQFSTAGGDFAKDFKTSIGKFDTATAEYAKASAAMIRAAGLLSNGLPWVPNNFMNGTNQSKNQKAGSTRGDGG